MINTDVLYNIFIYFFTGYGVMSFSLAFVKTIFEPKKIYLNEDDFIEVDKNVKLGKRKKII